MSTWANANSFIEAPDPLFKYEGDGLIHEDNRKVAEANKRTMILPEGNVKELRKKVARIQRYFRKHGIDKLQKAHADARDTFNEARERYNELREIIPNTKPKERTELCEEYERLREQAPQLREALDNAIEALHPYRRQIAKKQKLDMMLRSHYEAIALEAKEDDLQKLLAKEAKYLEKQLMTALSRMGFSHRQKVGNNIQKDYVRFHKCVITPDNLQFKVLASKGLLFGGYRDMLPQGVFLSDLLTEKVMFDLSVATERKVWSPHIGDNPDHPRNGAFIVVDRLTGLDGIQEHVTYDQLMSRYDMADHDMIPIPAGMKEHRIVNWLNLRGSYGTHLMFTGITGSGKTVAMKAMATCLIETQSPRDVRFILIDLKQSGDFRHFEDAPHVIKWNGKSVLKEVPEIAACLTAVKAELTSRLKTIGAMANNIEEYNAKMGEDNKLPDIYILFDEYADTRDPDYAELTPVIDSACIRIARLGRSPGIHLWLGLQTPRRENMPQKLRDNMTAKFDGQQSMMGASQSVTGNRAVMGLADVPGRMICTIGAKSFQVQMPYVDEDDMSSAVKIALDTYGDVPAYELKQTEADFIALQTPKEIVLQTAMEVFNGELKARPIWDYLGGEFSQRQVSEIVKNITSEGVIEYQDDEYILEKQPGNWYLMVLNPDVQTVSHEDVRIETA